MSQSGRCWQGLISESVHQPVLCEEVVTALNVRPAPGTEFVWLDGTVGAGGHAALMMNAIADAEAKAWVVATDRDAEMLKFARLTLHDFLFDGHRADLYQSSYADLPKVMAQAGVKPSDVDALLLDLGANSRHFDVADRGFSFQKHGPLDMRFDSSKGETAADLIDRLSERELAGILSEYGEERFSKRIARAIKKAQASSKIQTTDALAEIVAKAVPKSPGASRIHPATRTFQALRIAVNNELSELQKFLANFPAWVKPGGRVAIISFHSLEDRMVKTAFQSLAEASDASVDVPKNLPLRAEELQRLKRPARVKIITRKPITATQAEIDANPRARSAKMRVVEIL